MPGKQKKMEFQTEAKQILDIVIHSLYTHKEIFLRELISNASDALDKLRFEALTNKDVSVKDEDLCVRIKPDKDANTLTVSDNGIGMGEQELIENIGTIARSGSKRFLEKLTGDQKADSNLIGKFGVGFYSVFMVASKVAVVSKRAGSDAPAVRWESTGENDFIVEEAEREESGTDVIIYLTEEDKEYAEDYRLRSLISKYSNFIAFPIYLPDENGKEQVVNQTKPIWEKSESEVKEEDYNEFYKQELGGFDEPLIRIHHKAEGVMQYSALIYIPEKVSPFEMYNQERKHGVKLYVKRVFISDDLKELVPEYLRFIKGVVDSEDLPLNVSRETLQYNKMINKINKALTGKVLSELEKISKNDPERYKKFWKSFGPVLKEGIHTDPGNKDKILELARFQSSIGSSEEDLTSLDQYVSRMRDDQKHIYYITGESRSVVEKSPHLEVFRESGVEVLYLVDPIDEFIIPSIGKYKEKELKSVTKGDLDLGEINSDNQEEKKKAEGKYKKLIERIKNILADDVKDVRVTTRLKQSPSCLVAGEDDMDPNMENLMKAMGQEVQGSKRILEINGNHPVVDSLQKIYEEDPKSERLEEWTRLLFDQALVAEGKIPSDSSRFLKTVNELLYSVSADEGEGESDE